MTDVKKNSRYESLPHRIGKTKIKQLIHLISQRIAFWIFENNSEEAFITRDKYEEICDDIIKESSEENKDIKRDFLISNYFEPIKHCEGVGTDELHFVHRSIYEYFVAVYFFESIHKLTSKEEVAGKLGELLKDGQLSKQILEFTKCKFDTMKGCQLPNTIKKIFQLMLRDGMNYHVGVPVLNIMDREMNIFSNMLEILSLFNITIKEYNDKIVSYLQYNKKGGLKLKGMRLSSENRDIEGLVIEIVSTDLKGVYLRGADLRGADLSEVDLCKADLLGADLRGANLRGANLAEADLRVTDLSRADLCETDLFCVKLKEANLSETLFGERQVNMICEEYDLSSSRVVLPGTGEIISYEEYCARKKA